MADSGSGHGSGSGSSTPKAEAGKDKQRDMASPTLSGHTESPSTTMKQVNEQSPLLSASEHDDDDALMSEVGALDQEDHYDNEKGPLYMILLTIGLLGLQLAWSVELSNGAPYILSLGLSKSMMAMVWLAGPLSGALVQPYVGILSDNSRSRWGKRSPFMWYGTAATVVSLLVLAWVKEIVGTPLGWLGVDPESAGVRQTVIAVAVIMVYVLDFAIATVQAGIRAFILDCAPTHQQEVANSYASRVLGVGNIIGYFSGFIDLPKIAPFLGNTQFKGLCIIASAGLAGTVLLSTTTVRERDPRLEPPPKHQKGFLPFVKKVFTSIRNLPPLTKEVCKIEFLSWIGFFPQLFYSSSYIADIYVQPYLLANPNMTPDELDVLYERATRVGTFALLMYAFTSLSANILLPFFVTATYDAQVISASKSVHSQKSYTTRASRFWQSLKIPWLTIRRAWMISHMIFALCMFSTLFATTVTQATWIIAIVGISWAMVLWAPFAIMSAEISKLSAVRRARQAASPHEEDDGEDQAGLLLGIHNMSVSTPQILATVGSSFVFKIWQKPRGVPGDRSFPYVMALGGIFAAAAAWLTSRMSDTIDVEEIEREVEREGEEGLLSERQH